MLRLKYLKHNVDITVLTSPMQPFRVPERPNWTVTLVDANMALEFAAFLKIPLSGQSVVNGNTTELYGKLDNISVSIPVTSSTQIAAIPVLEKGINYSTDNKSILNKYNLYKKLTRYIVEYTYWLFSQYVHDKPSSRHMDFKTIDEFVNEKIKIIPNFEYGHVPKMFVRNSGVMEKNKLILTSKEALKRLIYTLRVDIRRFRTKILNYYTMTSIDKYYVDITDFDQSQFQVILQGDTSVDKWIRNQKIKYHLNKSIQIGNRLPYFFTNDMISEKMYLAQNTDSLGKAIKIAEIWSEHGYNPGENPEQHFTVEEDRSEPS